MSKINIKELKRNRLIQDLKFKIDIVILSKRDAIKNQQYQKAAYFRDVEKIMNNELENIINNEKDV